MSGIHVHPTKGDDANDGSDWDHAVATLAKGMALALRTGEEVVLAGPALPGHEYECIPSQAEHPALRIERNKRKRQRRKDRR